jgi:hypothetical protein
MPRSSEWSISFNVRFKVLIATSIKMKVFWNIAPCSLVGFRPTFQRCVLPPLSGQWNLTMKEVHTSETSVYSETTRCYIPEGSQLLSFKFFNHGVAGISHLPKRFTYPDNLIRDLIILVLGTVYKLWNISMCSFSILLSLSPSFVLIFSSAFCSQTTSCCVLSLICQTRFHTHTKQTQG